MSYRQSDQRFQSQDAKAVSTETGAGEDVRLLTAGCGVRFGDLLHLTTGIGGAEDGDCSAGSAAGEKGRDRSLPSAQRWLTTRLRWS